MAKYYNLGGDIYEFEQIVYAERKQDEQLFNIINRKINGRLTAIIGCRQTGKTSLARRLMSKLSTNKWYFSFFDLRDYTSHQPTSPKALPYFVYQFASQLIKCAEEESNNELLNKHLLSQHKQKIKSWFTDITSQEIISSYQQIDEILSQTLEVLEQSNKKVLIILDEFEGFNQVAHDYEKLLLFIGKYANNPKYKHVHWLCTCLYRPSYDFNGLQPSKFHINELFLQDFKASEQALSQWSEGIDYLGEKRRYNIVNYVLEQTGGQPYLTAKLLDKIQQEKHQTIKQVQAEIKWLLTDGDAHFDTCLMIIKADHKLALRAVYAAIDLYIYQKPLADKNVKTLLLSSGLIKESSDKRNISIKCPIYQSYYHHDWFKNAITQCSLSVIPEPTIKNKNKKKLLLINAGGTMGMEVDAQDGTVHEPKPNQSWLRHFPQVNELAIIDYLEVFPPTDGANIGIVEWQKLANCIYEYRNKVDGVVIIHGTDTLAYSASAIAFALGQELPFPVVLTGSQAPHNIIHADAEINLHRACMVASLGDTLPEVLICFNDEVYRGVRTQKQNDFHFAGFHSPSTMPLARIGQSIKLNDIDIIKSPLKNLKKYDWRIENNFESRVFRISQFPGLSKHDLFLLLDNSDIKGYVIESLGIGNLPTNNAKNNDYYLNDFIRQATNKGIPVLISSHLPIAPEFLPLYSAASGPIQAGAIPTGNMTPAAALTKFMWVLGKHKARNYKSSSNFISQIKKVLLEPLIGELDPFEIESF